MKELIIKAIETDVNLNRTLRVLNTNDNGAIAQRYEEEYRRKTGGREARDDYVLAMALSSASHHLRTALQIWVRADLWMYVKEKLGALPDEIEFALALHEALNQLRLGHTLAGAGFRGGRNDKPPELPVEMERIKPKTMRW